MAFKIRAVATSGSTYEGNVDAPDAETARVFFSAYAATQGVEISSFGYVVDMSDAFERHSLPYDYRDGA